MLCRVRASWYNFMSQSNKSSKQKPNIYHNTNNSSVETTEQNEEKDLEQNGFISRIIGPLGNNIYTSLVNKDN